MRQRHLIVNADDFGMSDSVNEGVLQAHEQGVVTSATLMVHRPAAPRAADLARQHRRLSIGLHVDLAEWVFRDGAWAARYELVDTSDRAAVTNEVERQVRCFEELLGRGPTHLDSHQHVHRHEPASAVLREIGGRLGVPVRHQSTVRYRGDFYGQTGTGDAYPDGITVDALCRVLASVPEGWTELGCHPGRTDPTLDDPYGPERGLELASLCDDMVREQLDRLGIVLASFRDAADAGGC